MHNLHEVYAKMSVHQPATMNTTAPVLQAFTKVLDQFRIVCISHTDKYRFCLFLAITNLHVY